MVETIKIITIVLFIPLDLLLFYIIWKNMFDDFDDFWDCIKHKFTPDLYSLAKGKLMEDWKGEHRLGLYIFACVIIVLIEVFIFHLIFK